MSKTLLCHVKWIHAFWNLKLAPLNFGPWTKNNLITKMESNIPAPFSPCYFALKRKLDEKQSSEKHAQAFFSEYLALHAGQEITKAKSITLGKSFLVLPSKKLKRVSGKYGMILFKRSNYHQGLHCAVQD